MCAVTEMSKTISNPWLPARFEFAPNFITGRILIDDENYQIYETVGAKEKVLFCKLLMKERWCDLDLMPNDFWSNIDFCGQQYYFVIGDQRELANIDNCSIPRDSEEALLFALSLRRTRSLYPTEDLSDAIYSEKHGVLLPVGENPQQLADDVIIGKYISGGVEVSCLSCRRVAGLSRTLSEQDVIKICHDSGLQGEYVKDKIVDFGEKYADKKTFLLPGRHVLQNFFNDYVIDVVSNPEQYRQMGIEFPSAFVLEGPPGCGKTFAVEKLVEYLDWPLFSVDSSSIGSKYIHETGMKIAEVFKKAMDSNPSVIIIDEMEAYLTERDSGSTHRIEEVGEFLRMIPQAAASNVLVIGMTNRIELIDKAILRRGRFDHVITVDMPSVEEIQELLEALLSTRNHDDDIDVPAVAKKMVGCPLSDVVFLIREAARLTARAGASKINRQFIEMASSAGLERVTDAKSGKIGFIK